MSTCLSLSNCWLPRTIFFQRIFLRLSTSDISSSHRSASRFSLKIARFLYSKEHLTPLSTHAHYTKTETSVDIQEIARDFVLSLEPGELKSIEEKKKTMILNIFADHRRILSNELTQVEKLTSTVDAIPILPSQLAFGKRIDLSIDKFLV
jgi:hypothetical protein